MSSQVMLENGEDKELGFIAKSFIVTIFLIVPALFMGYITYEIWLYFLNYIIYSPYLMGQQDSMSLPLHISLILLAVLLCITILIQFCSKKFMGLKHWSKSEISFLERLKKSLTNLNIVIYIAALFPLAVYLSVVLSLVPPGYKPYSTAIVNDMALHESGHGLINAIVFPDTTSELRLFNSADVSKVAHFLGQDYAKYLPGGVHISNGSPYSKDEVYKKIEVSLGGLSAEEVLSPTGASLGASSDLEKVESYVTLLVNNGLSSLGPTQWDLLSVEQKQKLYAEIVNPLHDKTKQLLLLNQDSLKRLSSELAKRTVIDGVSAKKILGPLKEK